MPPRSRAGFAGVLSLQWHTQRTWKGGAVLPGGSEDRSAVGTTRLGAVCEFTSWVVCALSLLPEGRDHDQGGEIRHIGGLGSRVLGLSAETTRMSPS